MGYDKHYYYQDNYYSDDYHHHNRWDALDQDSKHPVTPCSNTDNDDLNDGEQVSDIDQSSKEVIVIRDSCDINVETTDTKVAASLQAAIQVAISVVINITIADSSRAEQVTQELLEMSQIHQSSQQKLVIVNSRTVDVTTTDTDVAISLQVMLQILLALFAQLGIL